MACFGLLLYARCRWLLRAGKYRCEFSLLGDLVVVTYEVGECASLVGLLESVSVALLAERLSSQSRHLQEICCEKRGENRTSFFL